MDDDLAYWTATIDGVFAAFVTAKDKKTATSHALKELANLGISADGLSVQRAWDESGGSCIVIWHKDI